MHLKKDVIENTKLPEKGQIFLWDSELVGFGVRLTPNARTYIAQARIKKDKTRKPIHRRITLGRHGILTLQEARKKAKQALLSMGMGIDPKEEQRRAEAYSLTLQEVVEKYVKDRRNLKQSSIRDIHKHLNKAFADWKSKPIVFITRERVLKKFQVLSDRGPTQANQAFRVLRAFLNYAMAAYQIEDRPIIPQNPVNVLSDTKIWNHTQPRSGKIPIDKIGAVYNLLQDLRTTPERTTISQTLADVVTFLLLTGCRWNEAASLTWENVNIENGSWFIADPKNRNPIIFPLSDIALEMLKDRPKKNMYVFSSHAEGKHITTARRVFEKISDIAGLHISAHDLRRTFRAIAGECGIDFWKTKLLMGHKLSGDITITHYTETQDLSYLKKDIDKINQWIVGRAHIAEGKNIIQFPAGGKAVK
jgi:integrase